MSRLFLQHTDCEYVALRLELLFLRLPEIMDNETETIVNKVAGSGLQTLDLESLFPVGARITIDLAPLLFQGLILREKDLRNWVKETDWSAYEGKLVAVSCSADAIVPTWAFMLVAVALAPFAGKVVFGNEHDLDTALWLDIVNNLPLDDYRNQRVVVKGCSTKEVPVAAYAAVAARLTPVVKSLMFGEPCSTVPLYNRAAERPAPPPEEHKP